MNQLPPSQPAPDPDSENPLLFWVAYIPGEGKKKNYLSDGNGHLRVFKSEGALRDWLKPQLRPEVYEMVVVHSLQGQIALPDDGTITSTPAPMYVFDAPAGQPIKTLALPTVPTSQELLNSLINRRRRRRN